MKYLSTALTGLLLAGVVATAPEAAAQLLDPSTDVPANLGTATNGQSSLKQIIVTGINWLLGFLGLIAIIMVIYGGFLYLTSGGDDAAASKGRTVILYAIIGIVIILLSYAIVNTVIRIFEGQPPQ